MPPDVNSPLVLRPQHGPFYRPDRLNRHHKCGLLLGYFFSILIDIIADIAVIEELGK